MAKGYGGSMSIIYCNNCCQHIDADYQIDHKDDCYETRGDRDNHCSNELIRRDIANDRFNSTDRIVR